MLMQLAYSFTELLNLLLLLLLFSTVYARVIENKADRLVLNCSISGFDTNLPTMDYDWTLNDALIPHAHEHAVAAASMRSAAELASSSKFFVRLDGTELSLTVNNPSMIIATFVSVFCVICFVIVNSNDEELCTL